MTYGMLFFPHDKFDYYIIVGFIYKNDVWDYCKHFKLNDLKSNGTNQNLTIFHTLFSNFNLRTTDSCVEINNFSQVVTCNQLYILF